MKTLTFLKTAMKDQPPYVIATIVFFLLVLGAAAVFSVWKLARVVVSSAAWPAPSIEACDGDAACSTLAIVTEAPLFWVGAVWFAALVALVVRSRRFPPVDDSISAIREKLADQRIGLAVGWVLVYSSVGFIAALLTGPVIAALVANAAWTQEKVDRCSDDRLCLVTTLPGNGLPVWVAFAWIAVIATAMVICWKPARWWLPSPQERRFSPNRPFFTPFGVGPHAILAAVASLFLAPGLQQRDKEVYAPEYLWAFLAASTLAAVAWYRYQKVVGPTDPNAPPALVFLANARLVGFNEEWREVARSSRPLISSPNEKLRDFAEHSRSAVIGIRSPGSDAPLPAVRVRYPADWIGVPDFGPEESFGSPHDWAQALTAEMAAAAHTQLSSADSKEFVDSLTALAADITARGVQRCYLYFDSFRGIFAR